MNRSGDLVPAVTGLEVLQAARRIGPGKAPGPDGVNGGLIKETMEMLGKSWCGCFTRCISEGCFPARWKIARLVLLKKDRKPDGLPSSYRPICLLNDAGKMLERILANRLNRVLEETEGLSALQFGFREGRSTLDAVKHLRELVRGGLEDDKVVLVISLDIANAFNSLPWHVIHEALVYKEVPEYIRVIARDYLRDRWLIYEQRNGGLARRRVTRGVPQGSVLGPLFWNIAYDSVLRLWLPEDCHTICYADDTVVIVMGECVQEARVRAEMALELVTAEIRRLGLRISPQKTEAMCFGVNEAEAERIWIHVAGVPVAMRPTIKYLGIVLDTKWNFKEHFRSLLPRVERTIAALGRIMPNLRGPGERRRRLYAEVIHSIIMYGAPIWIDAVERDRRIRAELRKVQRRIALRVISAYRTVSYEAATILARIIPADILMRKHSRVFERTAEGRGNVGLVTARARAALRKEEKDRAINEWKTILVEYEGWQPGFRVREALVPKLREWINRNHGALSFRMTQLITGHGVFNNFLHRIGRADSPVCAHCEEATDTAQHTLELCSAWNTQRSTLREKMGCGQDLSLGSIFNSIIPDRQKWDAFAEFCESVMEEKERAERERQRASAQNPRPAARSQL